MARYVTNSYNNAIFIFHNVGQGLFYTGEIRISSNKVFRFVYDCGSENEKIIENAIKKYKENIKNDNKINILFISHFHYDHISGIKYLLENFNVDWVVIPYFTPIERLEIALLSNKIPDYYIKFLHDQIEYLLSNYGNKIEKILVIIDKIDKTGEKKNILYNPEYELSANLHYDENKERIIIEGEGWNKNRHKISITGYSGEIVLQKLWKFILFYHKKTNENEIKEKIKQCIKNLNISVNLEDNRGVKEILSKEDLFNRLRNCYQKIYRDLNETSLVLYHESEQKIKDIIIDTKECRTNIPPTHILLNKTYFVELKNEIKLELGTLLTGDQNLRDSKIYTELITYLNNHLNNVLIMQVPHHGSVHSWNSNIPNNFKNCLFFIISAGIKNRYKHPHKRVIRDLLLHKRFCFWVNEHNKFIYYYNDLVNMFPEITLTLYIL